MPGIWVFGGPRTEPTIETIDGVPHPLLLPRRPMS